MGLDLEGSTEAGHRVGWSGEGSAWPNDAPFEGFRLGCGPGAGGAASGKSPCVSAIGAQGGESRSIDLAWAPPSFPELVD